MRIRRGDGVTIGYDIAGGIIVRGQINLRKMGTNTGTTRA
jgi:hypothetical protein